MSTAPLPGMLYLPEGNQCGGSSEPAWVASSWVSTPPTQSSPPPRLCLGSPPLEPRGRCSSRSLFEEAPWMLTHGLGVGGLRWRGGGEGGCSLSPGCCSQTAVSRDSCRPSEEPDVATGGGGGLRSASFIGPVRVDADGTRPPNPPRKYCCCLFTPVQSERGSSKVAELPSPARQRPRSSLARGSNPARNGASTLDGASNFQPIRDAAERDRGAD